MAAWPGAAAAQQPGKLPTIGVLGTATPPVWSTWTAAFAQRLRELGWTEGRNLALEYRWAQGRPERFAEIAAEFVRLRGRRHPHRWKLGPRGAAGNVGHSHRLCHGERPGCGRAGRKPGATGRHVTGLSVLGVDLAGKRLELLREAVPRLRRLGILANAGYPDSVVEMGEVEATAHSLGLEVTRLEIRRVQDIAPAFETRNGQVEAIYVVVDGLITTNRTRIITMR